MSIFTAFQQTKAPVASLRSGLLLSVEALIDAFPVGAISLTVTSSSSRCPSAFGQIDSRTLVGPRFLGGRRPTVVFDCLLAESHGP